MSAARSGHDSNDLGQQVLRRLARLENKVDSIDQTSAFALRADYDRHKQSVTAIFRDGKRRAQVYLAANGLRTVQQIAAHLKMKAQHVSRELTHLSDEGLLEIAADSGGSSRLWKKKALDRSLRISQFLEKEYSLSADGHVQKLAARKSPSRK
jgi:DNA-binding MarR family transcriptional regulator